MGSMVFLEQYEKLRDKMMDEVMKPDRKDVHRLRSKRDPKSFRNCEIDHCFEILFLDIDLTSPQFVDGGRQDTRI